LLSPIIKFLTNEKLIKTLIVLVLLVVVYFFLKKVLNKLLHYQTKKSKLDIRKFNTLNSLFTNIIKYLLLFIGVLVVLNSLGMPIATIVAGLSVVGVVVGLAFQDMLKDFISGIFILIENQFSVGDTIEVSGFKGEVTSLGFKTTRIKKYTGEIMIISNRNIIEVINYSKSNSLAVVEVSVSYEDDIEKVENVLNKLCEKLSSEIKELKGKIEVLGVDKLDNSAVVFKITALTEPMKHFVVQRILLKEIKLELDRNNIKIPYPQVEVHNGNKL